MAVLLLAGCIAIFFLLGKEGLTILNIVILSMILVLGGYVIMMEIKKTKERADGLPEEDELSALIKYKSGYRAYMVSMYMWLFIFIFKDKFPDIETMLGGGILLSAVIFMLIRATEKRKYLETNVGNTVKIIGSISKVYWQHMIASISSHPHMNYFDLVINGPKFIKIARRRRKISAFGEKFS